MTRILKDLEPGNVFRFFEEICAIPHGSKNTAKISQYCVDFAKERNLKYIQDESNNVIIFKEAFAGYEDHPTVIIQGHLDMVCEKTPDSEHDFENEGLKLYVEEGFVKAKDTTLGGDDGIAVAYALAILDDDSLAHPPLEVVFTVDEEIGMLGADALDMSPLKGKYMLNIDSEEEGIFLTSCAGGLSASVLVPVEFVDAPSEAICGTIEIGGMKGGHSGTEINRYRANAHKVLGRLMHNLNKEVRYGIEDIVGGTKDNAIACNVKVCVVVEPEDKDALIKICDELLGQLKNEYEGIDNDIFINVTWEDCPSSKMIDQKAKEILTYLLVNMPNGVMKMSGNIDGLVETSLNCGIMNLTDEGVNLGFAVRSSVESAKWALYEQLEYLAGFLGCECTYAGSYPGWQYKSDSVLRQIMIDVYKEQYGSEPEVTAIHAGLECGIFADRIPGVDIVSFGPDIHDIHTFSEKLSIESTKRVWDFTCEVLKRL